MGLSPGLKRMLRAVGSREAFTGEDLFGNETYAAPTTFNYAPTSGLVNLMGEEDGHGKQDTIIVAQQEIIVDAGTLAMRDRVGGIFYVVGIETTTDKSGAAVCQTVSLDTRKKG